MFDSEYFRTVLQADVDALGGNAVVEVHLLSGQSYRLRSVASVHNGYVTFEGYQTRGDEPRRKPRWKEEISEGKSPHETERTVVAYESIANVIITAVRPDHAPRIGFAGR
ncbi:MAG: hypothetical protein NVS4B3_28590 [Gemmatimonadaceae bacterium]